MRLHTSLAEAAREAPKLMTLSAFIMGAASQCPNPYQNWMLAAGIMLGVTGILLKKPEKDDGES